jgi:hypothetical protein
MTTVISVLLAIITVIGAWIAFQQMLIARTKLNHDLFERRFAVYSATRAYIVTMLKNKGGTQEDAVKWFSVASSAPFLFEREISEYLKEVEKRGSMMRARVGDKFVYEVEESVAEYNENFLWLSRSYDELENKFQDSMNLFQLNPLSIKNILPFCRRDAKFGDNRC